MLYVQLTTNIVGAFPSQAAAAEFAAKHEGDLIDPILDPSGGTKITSVEEFEAVGYDRVFYVVRAGDGWVANPQPPLPATSTFLGEGWKSVALQRESLRAVDWFPSTDDYKAFVEEFGRPPT